MENYQQFPCYNIRNMDIPLQQTKKWQKFQNDQNFTTFFQKNQDFSYLAIKNPTKLGDYLYLPYGPYLAQKNAAKTVYKELETLAKQENIIFIRIEPQDAKTASYLLKRPNCHKSHDLNPARTWILDLTPEKSTILTNFDQGTRTRYNNFTKKHLSVTTSKNPADIKYLVTLQQKLAETKKIGTFSPEYLKTELKQDFATLYLVHYQNPATAQDQIIAASLFFDHQNTRFYMQSAADLEFKKLPATVALLSTAIFDAKAQGLKKFDFWGIAPENAPKNHPWAGFTSFKKSFGGYPVDYAGTYDLVFQPAKYRLYLLLRALNRFKRKILR